jgi:hypothetical protein
LLSPRAISGSLSLRVVRIGNPNVRNGAKTGLSEMGQQNDVGNSRNLRIKPYPRNPILFPSNLLR